MVQPSAYLLLYVDGLGAGLPFALRRRPGHGHSLPRVIGLEIPGEGYADDIAVWHI
jgi:hypothetical protein